MKTTLLRLATALSFATLLSITLVGKGHSETLRICINNECNGLHPQIQHPEPPATEQERQEAEQRASEWEAYCKPTPVFERYAYVMHYAHAGCEYGRRSD